MLKHVKIWYLYLIYVLTHKYYVLIACWKTGIEWRGLVHDLSKFRPREFLPYSVYFYSTWNGKVRYESKPTNTNSLPYDRAWQSHKNSNKHHWQYWVTINDKGEVAAIPMPISSVLEMVCDWYGAGRAQENPLSTREWFESKKDSLILHTTTVSRVYWALHILEERMSS